MHKHILALAIALTTFASVALASADTSDPQLAAGPETHADHALGAHGQDKRAEEASEPGLIRFDVSKRASDDLSGTLQTPSGEMLFSTASSSAGALAAKGSVPDHVQATLTINGAVIVHDFDYVRQAVTIRTADDTVLDADRVRVLKSFQREFGLARLTAENFMSMPRATEVLWRLSEMYAEAPQGIALDSERVIDLRREAPQQVDMDDPKAPALPGQEKACGRAGGGFIDLHDQGNVCDKGHLWRSEAHDYCSGPGSHHDYRTTAHQDFGCGSSSCYGRCGPGCGVLNGQGAWQKDCLDHDVCNRSHDAQLGGCGDEWNEAADDYLNGEIHCIFDHC